LLAAFRDQGCLPEGRLDAPHLVDEGGAVHQSAEESARWRSHPRVEVQRFLAENPDYEQGVALVTLVPLTWRNLAVGSGRLARAAAGPRKRR
jgi:hypothetical protein